eukprot:905142-Alexandrium_andersonii.AAC.1
MSASLVGSEMCIRDSARSTWRRAPGGRPGTPPRGDPKPLCEMSLRQHLSCLLYTSDAADDM